MSATMEFNREEAIKCLMTAILQIPEGIVVEGMSLADMNVQEVLTKCNNEQLEHLILLMLSHGRIDARKVWSRVTDNS